MTPEAAGSVITCKRSICKWSTCERSTCTACSLRAWHEHTSLCRAAPAAAAESAPPLSNAARTLTPRALRAEQQASLLAACGTAPEAIAAQQSVDAGAVPQASLDVMPAAAAALGVSPGSVSHSLKRVEQSATASRGSYRLGASQLMSSKSLSSSGSLVPSATQLVVGCYAAARLDATGAIIPRCRRPCVPAQ